MSIKADISFYCPSCNHVDFLSKARLKELVELGHGTCACCDGTFDIQFLINNKYLIGEDVI